MFRRIGQAIFTSGRTFYPASSRLVDVGRLEVKPYVQSIRSNTRPPGRRCIDRLAIMGTWVTGSISDVSASGRATINSAPTLFGDHGGDNDRDDNDRDGRGGDDRDGRGGDNDDNNWDDDDSGAGDGDWNGDSGNNDDIDGDRDGRDHAHRATRTTMATAWIAATRMR